MTKGEAAFVAYLKEVVPSLTYDHGRDADGAYLLKVFWEMHEDWQQACWWAWQHPEEACKMRPARRQLTRPRVKGATWVKPGVWNDEVEDDWKEDEPSGVDA